MGKNCKAIDEVWDVVEKIMWLESCKALEIFFTLVLINYYLEMTHLINPEVDYTPQF
jgi:hypothetical protein